MKAPVITDDATKFATTWYGKPLPSEGVTTANEKKRKRQPPKAKNWFLTFQTEEFTFPECTEVNYAVYSRDTAPTTGKVHWHAYVQFKRQKRYTGIEKIFGKCDHRIAQDKHASIKYIKAKESPQEIGSYTSTGDRTDLMDCKKKLDKGKTWFELAQTHFAPAMRYRRSFKEYAEEVRRRKIPKRQEIKIFIIWGPTGSGKTHLVYDRHPIEDIYALSTGGKKLWFSGYTGQGVLLIDEFYGQCQYATMLRLTHEFPYQAETKGGHAYKAWHTVYILSNSPPCKWYQTVPSTDALKRRITQVYEMRDRKLHESSWVPSGFAQESFTDRKDQTSYLIKRNYY